MTVYGIVSGVASRFIREVLPALLMKTAHRPTLYRIQSILARLVNGDRVTASIMADVLEVSRRTVARDIDYLINVLHVPIAYDRKRSTYILDGQVPILFSLNPVVLESTTPASEEIEVTIGLDDDLARYFSVIAVHPTQRVSTQPNGEHAMQMRIRVDDTTVYWILGFGDRMRVIKPEYLRDRVLEMAQSILTERSEQDGQT